MLPAGGCSTHLTAAALRGWWPPPLPADAPVLAAVALEDVRPERAGIRGTRTLQEHDGGDHLLAERHRDDLRRDRRTARAGWQRHGYTATDLTGRAVTVLRDADRALGREHRPERVRAWHALLTDSLSTPAGTARLRARWGLVG